MSEDDGRSIRQLKRVKSNIPHVVESARILDNESVAPGIWKISFEAPAIANDAMPGQFVMVRVGDRFLPRPFSIYDTSSGGGVELLFQVKGKGTEAMSRLRPEDVVHVFGPLGKGYRLQSRVSRHVLVAGGIGIAGLNLLAKRLAQMRKDSRSGRVEVLVYYGVRTANLLVGHEELEQFGIDCTLVTEDGSAGRKGVVTEILRSDMKRWWGGGQRKRASGQMKNQAKRVAIYACGPREMLRCVAELAEGRGIVCQVSVEERMACGVGACRGCAVKLRGREGYAMVCKDGPVFDSLEICLDVGIGNK